ncbi:MAG TPA: acyltransferase [Verrucomicrobiae bacterium]|jgi:peptidoglycan/LPS O-acetylase OafA/YrhL|nr:acyltransferase [Verrucomicrobiae bacterium]
MNPTVSGIPKSSERKIENIQALRGVAILLVLFHHVGRYEERFFTGGAWFHFFSLTGWTGVDLFFVISGFVMATITRGRFQKSHGTKTFLLRRAGRIYPLYWFYTLLYLPIFLFKPEWMNRPGADGNIAVFQSFFLLPQKTSPIVGQGWTLVYEMFFYLVFGLILLRPERQKIKILFAWAMLIIGGNILCQSTTGFLHDSPALLIATDLMILEFIAGCFVAELVAENVHRGATIALVVGLVTLPVIGGATEIYHLSRVLCLLPAALVVYGAASIEAKHKYVFPKPLRFVGDISYSLYLGHMAAVLLVMKFFQMIHPGQGPLVHLAFISTAIAAALALGVVSYYWIEKPLLQAAYVTIPKLIAFWNRGYNRLRGNHAS